LKKIFFKGAIFMSTAIKFGSVCSGIEAASVAWHPLGWKAAWLSEIEPFPSAVLAHHYPNVPNLGDMTALPERIQSGEIEAPDVFCGGTPCQAFSVAGLRKSLDDARGNLSLTFVGIANAIDHARSVRGEQASIVFWENVPGVISTKDNAFGCFLAGLAGEDDPLVAPGGKWANAGYVSGPKRAVAWRVLDAQYFGLAQRRRRVFVVSSARNDFDPAAVLFEFDGVRRDSAPSREAREGVARGIGIGPPFSRTGNERVEAEAMVVQPYDVGNCLTARMHKGINSTLDEGQTPVISIHPHCIGRAPEAGPQGKEYLLDGSAYCMDSRGQPQAVAQPIAFHPSQDPISSTDGTTHGLGCGSSGGQASVAVSYGIRTANTSSNGWGIQEEVTHTLDCAQGVAVAQPIVAMRESGFGCWMEDTVAGTLDASMGMSGHANRPAVMTVFRAMAVRRLTPVECERLQGFPDNYTNIPWRKKPASECPDGPRYKALGNSWAVPVVAWIGQRIQNKILKGG
jgi:DNA (cytosine-5)-methyltransferase 1